MNAEQLCSQVGVAPPGRQIIYHSGHLVVDRYKERARREIDTTAFAATTLAERGYVLLVQKRNGPHDYDYIAVRTKKKDR